MKIVPQNGPTINSIANAQPKEIGPSARERAITKYMEGGRNHKQQVSASGESKFIKTQPQITDSGVVDAPVEESTESVELGHIENNTEVAPLESSAPLSSPKTEVKALETPAETDEPLSNQYALLARKEKALRAKAQAADSAAKAREEAFRAKEEALKAKELEYSSKYVSKDRLKSDLPSLLAEMGLSSEEIANVIYNAPKPEEVALNSKFSAYENRIKQLEEKLESSTKSFEEKEKQSYEQAVNQIHHDIKRLVASDESFEMIKETGSTQDVVDLIKKKFDTEGELLDIHEAAQLVEDELFDRYLKASKLKKIQSKLSSERTVTSASKSTEAARTPQQSQPLKTLTNSVASGNKLSRRERAIKRYNREEF